LPNIVPPSLASVLTSTKKKKEYIVDPFIDVIYNKKKESYTVSCKEKFEEKELELKFAEALKNKLASKDLKNL